LNERTKTEKLKHTEIRLISELMKDSSRSDRELAKTLKVSQPTITRTRKKLEDKGIIREYTIVPDFSRLGYQIMGITFIRLEETPSVEKEKALRKAVVELEERNPYASLMAVNGEGMQRDRMFITFYRDYADFVRSMRVTKRLPHVNVDSVESFLVNLKDENNYRILTLKQIANNLQSLLRE
jgi:DNA-binding Lrp family transcriptional regulator